MSPETWHASIGVATSLVLEIVVLGLLLLVSRQRRSPSKHRKARRSDELPAQFLGRGVEIPGTTSGSWRSEAPTLDFLTRAIARRIQRTRAERVSSAESSPVSFLLTAK